MEGAKNTHFPLETHGDSELVSLIHQELVQRDKRAL
jgi:hypothetical protein